MKNAICLLLLIACFAGCKATVSIGTDEAVIALPSPISIDEKPAGSTEPVIDAGASNEALEPPKEEPKRNTVIQYTIKSCRWCDYDRERILPQWVKNGWDWKNDEEHVIDETAKPTKGAYPFYEIYDANGVKKTHKGSLLSWRN